MNGFTRREALSVLGTTAVAAGVCGLNACQTDPMKEEKPPTITSGTVTIGPVVEYPAGSASVKFVELYGIVVVNDSGTPVAIRPKCTHMGCIAKWKDETHTFECPCHGSIYNMLGQPIKGPAKRPLPAIACRRNDAGILTVDLTKLYSL